MNKNWMPVENFTSFIGIFEYFIPRKGCKNDI